MTRFLCPHCGAPKGPLRAFADIDNGDEGPDSGFVFCKDCMTLIVWELEHETQTVRAATADEAMAILGTPHGLTAFFNSLQKHVETRQ